MGCLPFKREALARAEPGLLLGVAEPDEDIVFDLGMKERQPRYEPSDRTLGDHLCRLRKNDRD